MHAETKDGIIEDEILFFVQDKSELLNLTDHLIQIQGVISVDRIEN